MRAFVVVAKGFDMAREQAEIDYRARRMEEEVKYLRANRDVWHAGGGQIDEVFRRIQVTDS